MTSKKNILFLLTDQQRFDTVGWHPQCDLATPNLDRIAEGTAFMDCSSVSPICTPARCALLTGRYAHQVNMRTMSGELSPHFPTVPKALQRAGYRTELYGKTHWWQGWSWFDPRPESHYDMRELKEELKSYGFDKVWEGGDKRALGPNKNHYTDYLQNKAYGGEYLKYYDEIAGATFRIEDTILEKTASFPFPEEDQAEAVITTKLIDSIRKQKDSDQPFCLFGHYFAPHDPFDPPQRFLDQVPYQEIDDFVVRPGEEPLTIEQKQSLWKLRQAYKALILMLDEQVGKIFNALEESGQLDNTVIFFSSDHGELMGDHRHTQKGLPWKQSLQVPTAIRHPDHLYSIRNNSPIEITDLSATMLEVAGLDPIEALSESWPSYLDRIPCRSLMPILRKDQNQIRDYSFAECDVKWHDTDGYQPWSWQLIASKEWKYVRYIDRKASSSGESRREELFNRLEDPSETENIASLNPETLHRLSRELDFVNDTTPTAQTSWIPFANRSSKEPSYSFNP